MAVDMTARIVTGAYRDAVVVPEARALAAEIDVPQAARAVTDDIMREVWPDSEDPTFYAAVLDSTVGNIATIFAILAQTADADAVPPDAIEFAEVTARLGVPIAEVDKAYRVGVASLWNMWFGAAREHADGGSIDDLISGPTLMFHAYVDRILDTVAMRHAEVQAETNRTLRDLRRRTLLDVLDGRAECDAEELSRTLDYGVADTHLALLIETGEARPPEREIAALRDVVDARDTLLLQHAPRTWVAWLGRPAGFDALALSRLRRALSAQPALTVALGEPGVGVEGLRRTRRQALEAARVQRALGVLEHRCIWARDVRLETLLLNDEARAREFIADELGGLSGEDAATARLRETLLAWLATGSHVSAAAMLGVHENTVRNRIRAAEELLGAPLMGRRTELQVALRLERVLSAPREGEIAAAA